MSCAIFLCEDVSRIPLRFSPAKKLFLACLARSVGRWVSRPGTGKKILIANHVLAGGVHADVEVLEPAHVNIMGGVGCDLEAIAAFSSHAASVLDRTGSEKLGSLTEMRITLGPLYEYLLRPAEAFALLLRERNVTDLYVFTGATVAEKIAMHVAESLGVRVHRPSPSLWSLVFALKHRGWSRNRFLPRRDQIVEHWSVRSANLPKEEHDDILIFAEEERRLRRAREIAAALKRSGKRVRVIAATFKKESRVALEEIRKAGIETASLSDYLGADPSGLAAQSYDEHRRAWERLEQDSRIPQLLYLGVPVWNVFRRFLGASWPTYSLAGLFARRSMEQVLRLHSPKGVLVMEVGLYSKALLDAAKARGVTSYWYSNNPILFTIPFWLPYFLRVFRPDKVVATGEVMGETLVSRGFYRAEDIITAGDVFLAPVTPGEKGAEARRRWGVPEGKKAVLCLSSYLSPDVSAEKLRRFHIESYALVRDLGACLLVKAHPSQNPNELKAQLAEWGVRCDVFFHTEPLMEVLSASDAAIMMFSQAGAEVLMSGVPLVILQEKELVEQFDLQFPYVREGAATLLPMGETESNREKLRPVLVDDARRAELRKKASRFVSRYVSVRHPDNAAYLAERLLQ